MTNNKIGRWEPYFKPTTRKHDSPGFSDAFIVDNRRESAYPDYDDLDELWESMNNKMKGETK